MIHVCKKKKKRGNKTVASRYYYLRYKLPFMVREKWISLEVTDKRVADEKARELIRDIERERAGIIQAKTVRIANDHTLNEHLRDYRTDLIKRNRGGQNGRDAFRLERRILRVSEDCGWKYLREINPNEFVQWRNKHDFSARYLNHFLEGFNSFLNWLIKHSKLESNPLRAVDKIDARGCQRIDRRALTDEELRKVCGVDEYRGMVYLVAARTGLRWGELRQLYWGDVEFGEETSFVRVRAATTKNKKTERLPLLAEVSQVLRSLQESGQSPTDLVFNHGIPRARRLQKDLELVGIPYINSQNQRADFHSFRYTFATFLQRNNIHPRIAMKLMRHSDIRLTTKTYTDESGLPLVEVVGSLPDLGLNAGSRIGVRKPVATSRSEENLGGISMVTKSIKNALNKGQSRVLSQGVVKSQMERVKGIESSTHLSR